ncbi:MAG TPA: AMP-binding protein, partial [Solirubrobacteraceae bacterium]|nr:AMP-binding protein [Solirubrobacteraceae bacterium]
MSVPMTAAQQEQEAVPRAGTGALTLGQMALRATEMYDGPALRWRDGADWKELSYADLARRARAIAKGLIELGIEAGDRVSILSNTRPEWTVIDMGVFCAGGVVAPIYHTNSPEECGYVLNHSDARVVFCEDADQLAKVQAVREDCPQLEHVVLMEGTAAGVMTLDALCDLGSDVADEIVDERVAAVDPHDPATLIYTSGTTGPPK